MRCRFRSDEKLEMTNENIFVSGIKAGEEMATHHGALAGGDNTKENTGHVE